MAQQDRDNQAATPYFEFRSAICQRAMRANSGIDAGQLWYFSVVEAGDEILDLAAPLRRDDAEFGKMSPYGVDQHGALAHQQIACPVQHQDGLLRFVLDRHEDHVRPHQCLDDCGSIIGVVLSAVLDVWLDVEGGPNSGHSAATECSLRAPMIARPKTLKPCLV